MSKTECVLAIDQGTTGSRVVLYGRDGARVASAYRKFPQYFPRPGWVEHDPLEIWESVVGCLKDVLEQATWDAERRQSGYKAPRVKKPPAPPTDTDLLTRIAEGLEKT